MVVDEAVGFGAVVVVAVEPAVCDDPLEHASSAINAASDADPARNARLDMSRRSFTTLQWFGFLPYAKIRLDTASPPPRTLARTP